MYGRICKKKYRDTRPVRIYSVDVLSKFTSRQFETVDVVEKIEHYVKRHVLKGWRLTSTYITVTYLTRSHACGERPDIVAGVIATG